MGLFCKHEWEIAGYYTIHKGYYDYRLYILKRCIRCKKIKKYEWHGSELCRRFFTERISEILTAFALEHGIVKKKGE